MSATCPAANSLFAMSGLALSVLTQYLFHSRSSRWLSRPDLKKLTSRL
jgi:hypothetical protein